MAKQTQIYRIEEDLEELGEIDLFRQDNKTRQEPPFLGLESFDDICFGTVSSPFQFFQEDDSKLMHIQSELSEVIAPNKEKPLTSFVQSFGNLNNFCTKLGQRNGENTTCSKVDCQALSTNDFIEMARENFIRSSSARINQLPELTSLCDLSDEKKKDVEVIKHLLASAEKVGQRQFNAASELLNKCDEYSSSIGNPVQRLVYYFSEALWEKINQETGGMPSKGILGKMKSVYIEEAITNRITTVLALHQQVPFCQVCQFTGMNEIIENVAYAKNIHIIELEIRTGVQCTILMQALADRKTFPVEHLKITAIGTKSKERIEEAGRRLGNFAQSINLSFSFNVVMVPDMLDLNEKLFELDENEVVAVSAPCILYTMIGREDRLENLMKVIRSMNPCVMVVTEIEANHNSPVFVNRFIEALFYYGAYFDCLVDCMSHDDPNRDILESFYFRQAILNMLTTEKEERTTRRVKINVWRRFFARFKVVEKELSMSSLYQAKLVTRNFACASSCSHALNGKSLIVGWKGTPILSASAWKFL